MSWGRGAIVFKINKYKTIEENNPFRISNVILTVCTECTLMLFIYLFWFMIYFHSRLLNKFCVCGSLPVACLYFAIYKNFKFSKLKSEHIICLVGMEFLTLFPFTSTKHKKCNNKYAESTWIPNWRLKANNIRIKNV